MVGRRFLIAYLEAHFAQLRGMIKMLDPAVQALLDAVAKQGADITTAVALIGSTKQQVTDLETQVAALVAAAGSGQAIDAADLAAIQDATGAVVASITTLEGALPAPVSSATVAGATAAAAAAVPGAS